MTAALALASVSTIAIERFIAQPPRQSADVIPFPSPAMTEPAANDNLDDLQDFDDDLDESFEEPTATGPATALIDRTTFTKAIELVERVAERRNTIPILSNVRIAAAGGMIAVTATDMDIEITASAPAAIDSHFSTTLPAKLLKDLLKKATPSDFVAITTGDGRDTLDFERVDYRLQSLPAKDFPYLTPPAADKAAVFTMAGRDFWDGLDATMGAISTEETRYYLNGVFMHVFEYGDVPKFRMVSTDGHRLYRRDFAVPAGAAGMEGVIVPRKTVTLLHGLLKGKGCPESVKIEVTESRLRFTFDNVVVTSKTIDGTYPDYMRVIPSHNDKVATFETAALSEALRAVSLISSERGRAFRLELFENSARMTVNNPDQGSAKADIACGYSSNPVEIGFNAGYMGEILSIVGDTAALAIADAGSPTVITGSRDGFTAVLMPTRV